MRGKKAQAPEARSPKTIVCIASGPSITQEDCDEAKSKAEVIAVNDVYRLLPDADHLYACDQRWWQVHIEKVKAGFRGKLYTQFRDPQEKKWADDHGIIAIPLVAQNGLGRDRLFGGSNSGHQAINLAYLMGATRIILLGYDMQNTGGKRHWFGDHPSGLTVKPDYQDFVKNFNQIAIDLKAEGVEVLNCSRETALTQFPRADLGVL